MRMKGRCNQYVYRLWAATAVVLVICFLFFVVKINVSAEVIDYHRWKDFIYYENGERDGQMTVTIRRYAGKEALLKIPKEIDGKVVTSIYGSAFRKCQNLKKILLPEGVSLGATALSSSPNLKKIVISKEHRTYSTENNLVINKKKTIVLSCPGGKKTAKIPKSVKYIANYAFSESSALKRIILKGKIKQIGSFSFGYCENLKTVTMGDSIKKVKAYAFAGCSKLNQLRISEKLKTVEEYAFTGCTSLKKVILPQSVSVIWENSFNGCTSLERIYIYNRNCTIKSSEYYSESAIPKDTVIYGYKGSTAEVFAKKGGYVFKAL